MTATMTKAEREAQRATYADQLRALLPPGSTVYCILRRVSRSGMMRHIALLAIMPDGTPHDITGRAARATGMRWDRDTGGLKMGGCGMDMGFSAVYNLAWALYRDSFGCIGEGCPSNDHSNGDRNYAPHQHHEAGYALRQRWM